MAKKQNKKVELIDPAQLDTYFKKRMYEIGLTDTSTATFTIDGDFPSPDYQQPIFAEDKYGNIVINYPCLYGGFEPVPGTETPFTRLRYKPENQPDQKVKYFQEKGSGVHLFHPPALLAKFKAKTKIETLFLVEGEFKAMAGSLYGIDIAGLGGKDLFQDSDKKHLHPDIMALVRDCHVENLVLLLDADVELVEWNHEEEPYKDLAKRLYSFYGTVIKFREMAKVEGLKDAYFLHLTDDNLPKAKGLDDLLLLKRTEAEGNDLKVIEDLQKLTAAKIYFEGINVGVLTPSKIKSKFRLQLNKGVPSSFYFWYESLILDREFVFAGARYIKTGEGLEMVRHEDTDLFLRSGCNYFKVIHVPNSKRIMQRRMVPWGKTEIKDDYVVEKGIKNFISTIPKYDAFCNVPCHTTEYEQVINGCYNLYYPLEHELEAGEWPTISKYLKHAFGEKQLPSGHTNYDLALDYLTLLYLNPTQRLPIVALVNKERNTGKTTFLFLLREIFKNNYTEIGNEELKDHLNDDWAPKLLIGIDEGFIDKKVVLERLKSMSTAHTIKLRGMYNGRQEISFFGKFVLTSNDETDFIKIEPGETRFWINKVPVLTEDDPDILDKMIEEIPAFLAYLKQREVLHPKKSRHWFDPELLKTEAGDRVKNNSKGWLIDELEEIIKNKFFHYKWHRLYYTQDELLTLLNDNKRGVKFRESDLRKQVNDKLHIYNKLGRYQQPVEPENQNALITTELKHGRCYEFKIENFLTKQEITEELGEYINYEEVIAPQLPPAGDQNEPDDEDLPF